MPAAWSIRDDSRYATSLARGCQGGASGEELACQCRRHKRLGFDLWVGKIPRRRAWQPTLIFLPEESHGQKSLVGYSPQGHKELGMTEVTAHTCTHVPSKSLAPQ